MVIVKYRRCLFRMVRIPSERGITLCHIRYCHSDCWFSSLKYGRYLGLSHPQALQAVDVVLLHLVGPAAERAGQLSFEPEHLKLFHRLLDSDD